jgi:hypothetical protein
VTKPSEKGLPVVFIACQVLQDVMEHFLPEELSQDVTFMDYGLHVVPKKMTVTLQEAIDDIKEPSLIVLGYGLCGNGLRGIKAGIHTLLIPRTDDCIAMLLGSYQAYTQQFKAVPGTYYLTKGWLESGSNPLQEYEAYVPKYGAERALWLMDQQYQHYERLVLVARSEADLAHYRPQAQEIARLCTRWDMRYEEILGSDDYVRRLVDQAAQLGQNGHEAANPPDGDFVVIQPGGEVRQDMFVRHR